MYVSMPFQHSIYRISGSPAGTPQLVNSSFEFPTGLALARDGTLFVAENNNNGPGSLYMIPANSNAYVTLATGIRALYAVGINEAVDDSVFLAKRDAILKIPARGTGSPTEVAGPGTVGRYPDGVGRTSNGDLYASDCENAKVMKVTGAGDVSVAFDLVGCPSLLTVTAADDVFVTDYNAGTVVKFTPSTNTSAVVATGFDDPDGVAVDSQGSIIVADNDGLWKITGGTGARVAIFPDYFNSTLRPVAVVTNC